MKEFLYWFVRAKEIINIFPEIFDLNPEGEKKGGRRSGGKYTISYIILKNVVRERNDAAGKVNT